MRKTHSGFGLMFFIAFFFLLCCGCSKEEEKVLVVLDGQNGMSVEETEKAARRWAEGKNMSIEVVAPKLSTVYEQQKILENSLKKKQWDLIIIQPLGNEELYPVLDYAKEQESLIVSISGVAGLQADYTIMPWNYEDAGVAIMEAFGEKMEQSGSYVTVVDSKDSEIILREELACINYQKNNYQQLSAVSRLQEGSDVQPIYDRVDELFHTYGMKGVLFFSHVDGLEIAKWKEHTGNDLITVGIGYPQLLKTYLDDGTIDVLFHWNDKNLLTASLEVGHKALGGGVEKDADVLTTSVSGYRTLRSMGNGAYYGSDIGVEYGSTP